MVVMRGERVIPEIRSEICGGGTRDYPALQGWTPLAIKELVAVLGLAREVKHGNLL